MNSRVGCAVFAFTMALASCVAILVGFLNWTAYMIPMIAVCMVWGYSMVAIGIDAMKELNTIADEYDTKQERPVQDWQKNGYKMEDVTINE